MTSEIPPLLFDSRVDLYHSIFEDLRCLTSSKYKTSSYGKTAFSVDVLVDSARHEIQFGHVTRSTHDNTSDDQAQCDVCAHKWTDLSEGSFGVTFLNDSKYACTVRGGDYQLSFLQSGRHPDARGDEGKHTFIFAFLPHRDALAIENGGTGSNLATRLIGILSAQSRMNEFQSVVVSPVAKVIPHHTHGGNS